MKCVRKQAQCSPLKEWEKMAPKIITEPTYVPAISLFWRIFGSKNFFFLLFPMCTRNGKGCVSSLTNVFDSQNWESSHKSRPESTFYFVFTCKSRFIPRKSFQQFFCLFFKVQNSWLWSCKCFSFIPMSLLLS